MLFTFRLLSIISALILLGSFEVDNYDGWITTGYFLLTLTCIAGTMYFAEIKRINNKPLY